MSLCVSHHVFRVKCLNVALPGCVLVALGVVLAFKSVSVGWVILSTVIFCFTVVGFTFSVYAMVSKAKSGAVLMLVLYYASNVTVSAYGYCTSHLSAAAPVCTPQCV